MDLCRSGSSRSRRCVVAGARRRCSRGINESPNPSGGPAADPAAPTRATGLRRGSGALASVRKCSWIQRRRVGRPPMVLRPTRSRLAPDLRHFVCSGSRFETALLHASSGRFTKPVQPERRRCHESVPDPRARHRCGGDCDPGAEGRRRAHAAGADGGRGRGLRHRPVADVDQHGHAADRRRLRDLVRDRHDRRGARRRVAVRRGTQPDDAGRHRGDRRGRDDPGRRPASSRCSAPTGPAPGRILLPHPRRERAVKLDRRPVEARCRPERGGRSTAQRG
jgi:hypothetical protein